MSRSQNFVWYFNGKKKQRSKSFFLNICSIYFYTDSIGINKSDGWVELVEFYKKKYLYLFIV